MGAPVSADGTLGHYRLGRLLGRGGMGQVWLAEDTRMGREVALKVLPPELAEDQEYRRRFEREARLAARLRGPHIVPIHNFGELDGRLFIDMELVDGSDLAHRLSAQGRLSPKAAVDIVAQVAEALDVAHGAGLIHRDVKPSNVLLLASGFAYLIDFGIARGVGQTTLTSTGVAVGTWSYMAPERFSGVEDLRSDVYSLACMLYECLTGSRPYTATNPAQQMAAHLTAPTPRASAHNPAVPMALDEVIARGMAKDPGHRYASAGELAAAARAALGASSSSNPAVPLVEPSGSPTVQWGQAFTPPPSAQQPHAPQPYSPQQQPSQPYSSQPRAPQPYMPQPYSPQPFGSQPSLIPQAPAAAAYSPHPGYASNMGMLPPTQAAPGRPRITGGRVVWWIVLGLLATFFALLTMVCIFGLITDSKTSLAMRITINLVFDWPFVLFVWLGVREFRKFQRR